MNDADTPVLEVRNLTVALPHDGDRRDAVSSVSFTVKRGEIVCLVGESGSGKTVIAQAIMGLLPKTLPVASGEVLLEGEDVTKVPTERLRQLRCASMSMIFQEPMTALNPVMTCGEQIDEVLREHTALSPAERRAKTIAIFTEVALPDPERIVGSYPHQLSGGQRQRIMIAMALVLEPVLLIADEPTTALDTTVQAQVIDLVRMLQAENGMSLLLITHDLAMAAEVCDRAVVMYAGYVVEDVPMAELLRRPRHPYAAALLGSLPRLDAPAGEPLEAIEGEPASALGHFACCPFMQRCRHADPRCDGAVPALQAVTALHSSRCVHHARMGQMESP